MKMVKIGSIKIDFYNSYDYYMGWDEQNKPFYNIVPSNQTAPNGGYYDKDYILKIKNAPDLFNPQNKLQ